MKKINLIIAILIILLVTSCSNGNGKPFQKDGAQEKAITVLIQEIVPGDLEKYIRITGKLEGITDITMVSETSGKIVQINKVLGDWVNAGESLGRIDNSDYLNQFHQAEASYLAAESAFDTAIIQMQVSESLYKNKQISETEFLQAKSSFKSAEAILNGSSAAVESSRKALQNSQFVAPVSGYISELALEYGEYISIGSLVANIVNNKQLIIRSGVGESDISFVEKGNDVLIKYNDQEYLAYVVGIGIKPVTGGNNYPVEIEFENTDMKLLPGMIVTGNIHTGTYREVIYTSIENLREKYDQDFVYVVNSENRVELRIVEIGEKIANNVIITSGLNPSEKLVIDGIDSISNGSLVEVKTGFELN